MRRANWIALALAAAWYAIAWSVIHPFARAPVVDGWLYRAAVEWFLKTGGIRFAGYTDAMPVSQVIYGAAWGKLFGTSHPSLEVAGATLGAAGVAMLYALARRCGAGAWQSALAAALLAGNPCYLFLSFSFMTEVPYLVALLAALLAFAAADGPHETLWLWLSAAFCAVAFLVRPFGGAAIAGCAGAVVLYDSRLLRGPVDDAAGLARRLAPYAVALLAVGVAWYWLTVLRPAPWDLERRASLLRAIVRVPLGAYIGAGGFGPLLYLGAVLAPLALIELAAWPTSTWLPLAGSIGVVSVLLARAYPGVAVLTELTCFGGARFPFYQLGLPHPDMPAGYFRWAMTAVGSAGGAAIILGLIRVIPRMNRAAAAVLLTALILWAPILPLWFFNDRYYLPLVPAACVLLALAPMPEAKLARATAAALTLILALVSLGGTYAYQRGLAAIAGARDQLLREGVARREIDAGYPINAEDEYRYPSRGADTLALEAGIPMLTTRKVSEYTISTVQPPGTTIVRTFTWPGPLGFGKRRMYVFRRLPGSQPAEVPSGGSPGMM